MSAITNPFELPEIVLAKVSLSEVLQVLRSRLNKEYMPSATGEVKFNSKPEYYTACLFERSVVGGNLAKVLKDFPSFPDPNSLFTSWGVIAIKLNNQIDYDLFALLRDHRVEVIVKLATCETLVNVMDSDASWHVWPDDPQYTIALDMKRIVENASMYL